MIRMASVVEGINEFCHQTSTSSDAQLKSVANELLLDSANMRAIVKHFEAKINAYASKSNLASLTEAQKVGVPTSLGSPAVMLLDAAAGDEDMTLKPGEDSLPVFLSALFAVHFRHAVCLFFGLPSSWK
ncbi:unnamed protein product [Schistocephalus solidus]|uniref:Uncharacterized protein n=1 Tax=Schistocephalus solidus TaxID=70667 RepID=A0A3P7CUR3_SCHSO|nr:unnamed protein product [Schistocephalus solidus]